MKAIRFMEPEVIEYSAVATPEPKDNEVLAQIAYAGFCATDIELLTGDMIHIKNGFTKYPIIPGHEWSGTIVAVGRDVRDLKVGDRITTIGGFYATIAAIKDDVITISFGPDSTKAMIARWAVRSLENTPEDAQNDLI